MFYPFDYKVNLMYKAPTINPIDYDAMSIIIDLGRCLEGYSMQFNAEEYLLLEKVDTGDAISYIIHQCSPFSDGDPDFRTKDEIFNATVSKETINVNLFRRGDWEKKFERMVEICLNEKQLELAQTTD